MRSLKQLEATAEYIGRFHKGTIRDFGPQQNHGEYLAGVEPPWVRENGQVVGLRASAYSQHIRTSSNVTINQLSTIQVSINLHSDLPWPGAPGSVYCGGVGASGPLLFILGINRLGITWGTSLLSANNVFEEGVPCVILATRDSSDVGHLFVDGVEIATGNVGAGTGSGNVLSWCGFTNIFTAQSTIYSGLLLDTYVTPEEASLLYEHARVQLPPGAPKRSGIMSVR